MLIHRSTFRPLIPHTIQPPRTTLRFSTRTPRKFRLHEVTPRDGLQNEKAVLSVEERRELVSRIMDFNPNSIEVGSFVRDDLVPAMARSGELLGSLARDETLARKKRERGITFAALIPNMKGFEMALPHFQSGILDTAVVLVSCSDSHSRKNVNKPMKAAFADTLRIVEEAKRLSIRVRAYASLAFGCPFEGKVDPGVVHEVCGEYAARDNVERIVLADTFGHGEPSQVVDFLSHLTKHGIPSSRLAFHFHDAHSRAHENVRAAMEMGVVEFDASVGGAGGCNFVPNTKGNVAIETILGRCLSDNWSHDLDATRIAEVNRWLENKLKRSLVAAAAMG